MRWVLKLSYLDKTVTEPCDVTGLISYALSPLEWVGYPSENTSIGVILDKALEFIRRDFHG